MKIKLKIYALILLQKIKYSWSNQTLNQFLNNNNIININKVIELWHKIKLFIITSIAVVLIAIILIFILANNSKINTTPSPIDTTIVTTTTPKIQDSSEQLI